MSFDIDFVDALGHVAYAEDLDVRVEPRGAVSVPAGAERGARVGVRTAGRSRGERGHGH